ncbi:Diphthamide biosynthesis protein 2 [Tetrabaena socialis]|uniref:Diphthamide biosynthesis protein 2 n=1 Tax=Tetrabaena socialis TaxID=47790 RepID=A0A2J8A6C7_9CHLO|nr:Diphthamide biosynthesis protein 2 [Tetrabaena socialis]|eukprot:PNH08060.1 Diphthamide biosynthesis protein 2 [Tetrabaena socialis]
MTAQLFDLYDVQQTLEYITGGGFRNVALQFPDELLADSPGVSALLQQQLGDRARVFILADTAYNPLGVDEVAAQHLAADCVVHYGRASLVPVNSLPALFVLPKESIDVQATGRAVRAAVEQAVLERLAEASSAGSRGYQAVVVLVDQGYHHRLEELRGEVEGGGGGGAACSAAGDGGGGGGDTAGPGCANSSSARQLTDTPPLIFAHVASKSLWPAAPASSATASAARPQAGSGCCASSAGPTAGVAAGPAPGGQQLGCGAASCCAAGGSQQGSAAEPDEPRQQSDAPDGGAGPAGDPPAACAGARTASPGQAPSVSVAGISSPGLSGEGDRAVGRPPTMAGLTWELPGGVERRDCLHVWVGPSGSSAQQVLQMTHSTCQWLSYDPAEGGSVRAGISDDTRRLLKRRNFAVEKARAANIVGILVGTLGSAGFRDVIAALRRMAAAAGKKSYTFLMGKPNPAKLGNFPEVDVFVMVADAQGLILDARDYLAPMVTPWEAALAFSGRHIELDDYRLELQAVLSIEAEPVQQEQDSEEGAESALQAMGHLGLSVASRGSGNARMEVAARSAAEYLALKRSYKGLEMPATGAGPKEVVLAVEGRAGRAAVYQDEQPGGTSG